MTKISFREKGEGKPLLCLHGYGGSVLHWEDVTRELTPFFRVITPKLTHLFMGVEKLTFSQQIDSIADFIRLQIPGERVSIMGISYGGALAWGLASRYPELIDKIICINPMPPFAPRHFALSNLRLFFHLPLPQLAVMAFLGSPFGSSFLQEAAGVFRNLQGEGADTRVEVLKGKKLKFMAHILWKFAWILRSEDWSFWEKKLENFRSPCLLIYDRKDPLFTPEFYDSFARKLSSTDVVATQDAGHISILQQPRLIAGVVKEYLLRDYYKAAEGFGF